MPTNSQLDEDLKQVVGQHQIEHRKTKQRQEKKEPPEASPPMQMPFGGVDVVIVHVLGQARPPCIPSRRDGSAWR